MAKIAKQLTELIGHTPLLELTNYEKALGLEAKIIAKLEYFNPLGSVKDRVAAAMIEQGIKDGKINQDTIIIEPTSGNTGIGLAFVAASKGLHLILIMPDTMSVERRKIVTALGAEIKCKKICSKIRIYFLRTQALKVCCAFRRAAGAALMFHFPNPNCRCRHSSRHTSPPFACGHRPVPSCRTLCVPHGTCP